MKRIVIVWPGFTGYAASGYRALAERADVRIYLEASVHEQQFDGTPLQGLRWQRVPDAASRAAALEEICAWRPDLVITCGWVAPFCRAVGEAEIPGARKILAMDMPWERTLRKFAARFVLAPYLRHFDGLFVPGARARRYARWLGFEGRVMSGSNPSGFERFAADEAFPSPQGFLFVGRFVREKGLDILLAAYARYRREVREPWSLDLVGCGDALPKTLPEGVRVVGFVPPERMPAVMREHACLVLPSRWEPWGVCAAEAMGAGLTTILSSACGLVADVPPTICVKPGAVDELAAALRRVTAFTADERLAETRRVRPLVANDSAERWAERVLALAEGRFAVGRHCLHLMAGLGAASGVANAARRFARVQRERGDEPLLLAPACKWNPVYFGLAFAFRAWRAARRTDEIWVHGSWTFPVWFGAFLAKRFGKRLVVVPSGSFDPVRLGNHAGWKKRLVSPLDRRVLRQADDVLALCPAEVEWVKAFEPAAKVREERVPVFIPKTGAEGLTFRASSETLRVLFLGRAQDPLKGVRYLEQAVAELNAAGRRIDLRIVSDHFGSELEADWAWCDLLCLPTLSENFGLVVAEALEHGKRVITTDGAPAWQNRPDVIYLQGYRTGTDVERVRLLKRGLGGLDEEGL